VAEQVDPPRNEPSCCGLDRSRARLHVPAGGKSPSAYGGSSQPGSARAGAQFLPSRISVFESSRSCASAGPLLPAVPPVIDQVGYIM